ncbi:TonB-dependent receptor [Aquabacterium sp. J223]|uniref:TonB-dependent receptor n=1 Tax=Aquabacterium sp. J223 TaxID=2898431 RepID=UPI0021ADC518|nr:TonB-dependent receptor [Aquabacterium sp. J223]UUX95988.1 TonB-dependent receptor [Aquabacterium sp. J223]
MNRCTPTALAAALSCLVTGLASAQAGPAAAPASEDADAPRRDGGVVVIRAPRAGTLPTALPATIEGLSRQDIETRGRAADAEDVLKYLPSLLVRKRYDGDHNHAILSSRASGTGNSARSMVYADGILLSNLLGNGVGGLSFPPRWGLVAPEEIERVDVLYGPFSAAFPGNSVGAVVDYVTRMPSRFEVHAKAGYSTQPSFDLYGTQGRFRSWQVSTAVGDRAGPWSWWLSAQRSDSHGQPLTFANRVVGGAPSPLGTPVTGAVADLNSAGQPWWILGSGTEYTSRQEQFKAKLAHDLSPTLRAAYTLGVWRNEVQGRSASYLRDAAGNVVSGGAINIGGRAYTLNGGDFPSTDERLTHLMHGLSIKSNTRGTWDWQVAASQYRYVTDTKRQTGATLPAGTLADGGGTGWHTLDLRGTWRPDGVDGAHTVDVGLQRHAHTLRYPTYALGDWSADAPAGVNSEVGGHTRLDSLWAQDAWRFRPDWKAVLGLRAEAWRAQGGTQILNVSPAVQQAGQRREHHLSPKAALSWQVRDSTVLKAALGRAVRLPTVAELYGATGTTNAQYINDANLRPERSWTGEVGAEQDLGNGLLRLTAFAEDTRDALYSQTTVLATGSGNTNVTRVQNVGRIATTGVEAAYQGRNVGWRGLDLAGSLTFADSEIKENAGFVATPGDTIGKRQPNIPRWRATALASWRFAPAWTATLAARHSGRQYRTLNNADVNGHTYMGVSRYLTVDARLHWKIDPRWTAAFGVDNLNNATYWNFHPYPQRTFNAELRYDL